VDVKVAKENLLRVVDVEGSSSFSLTRDAVGYRIGGEGVGCRGASGNGCAVGAGSSTVQHVECDPDEDNQCDQEFFHRIYPRLSSSSSLRCSSLFGLTDFTHLYRL